MATPREQAAQALDALARRMMDKGLIVEAGWIAFRALVISPAAPQEQVDQLRLAFFSGAQHLFASITRGMDPGEEPTEADERRMEAIHVELQTFAEGFIAEKTPTEGSA